MQLAVRGVQSARDSSATASFWWNVLMHTKGVYGLVLEHAVVSMSQYILGLVFAIVRRGISF